jgi:hypothetical protein
MKRNKLKITNQQDWLIKIKENDMQSWEKKKVTFYTLKLK